MLKRPEESSLGLGWPDHQGPRLLLCGSLLTPACDFHLLVQNSYLSSNLSHPYLVNKNVEDVKKKKKVVPTSCKGTLEKSQLTLLFIFHWTKYSHMITLPRKGG